MLSIFIATSLNGMIARPDGDFSWLFMDQDYGFKEYMKDVKGIVMGGETYRVCLAMGPWEWKDILALVLTRTEEANEGSPKEVIFVQENPVEAVKEFAAQVGGKVWLVGGGQINTMLWNAGMVSELIVSIHPIWLKDGIPMFAPGIEEGWMKLVDSKAFETGLIQVTYQV